MNSKAKLEQATGKLFGNLWENYDKDGFEESVQLFFTRLKLAGFDSAWFNDRVCLDAGCGGGRNSIAMARLGARQVIGIDIGEQGLVDARKRAQGMERVKFESASILDIPFAAETFDMVWCAGVMMITADEERALDELTRVVKKGGYLYLLVYATEGMRWPLIQMLRPLANHIGLTNIEHAIQIAGLPANKRRTFLDDLFCPRLDFYQWDRLNRMLEKRGYHNIQRWGTQCRLDHEASLENYRKDLESLRSLFAAGDHKDFSQIKQYFAAGRKAIQSTLDAIRYFEDAVRRDEISSEAAMNVVIGQGHHRVLAVKG